MVNQSMGEHYFSPLDKAPPGRRLGGDSPRVSAHRTAQRTADEAEATSHTNPSQAAERPYLPNGRFTVDVK